MCDKSDNPADGMHVRCCDGNDPATATCTATSQCITPCPFTSIYGSKGCMYCPGRAEGDAYVPCSGDETCQVTNRCTAFADLAKPREDTSQLWEKESSGDPYVATMAMIASQAVQPTTPAQKQAQLQYMMAAQGSKFW